MTDQLRKRTEELSDRHGFSHEAVLTLLDALIAGHGAMAQFSHPELGGMGQWTRGGMIMIGDMFNAGLRARVNDLCRDLADLLAQHPSSVKEEKPEQHSEAGGDDWWDSELGAPNSTGSQGTVRYAYFSAARRLAVSIDGKVTVYDTQGHEITGFSQQQGSDATLTFGSQLGPVPISRLPVVGQR